MRKVLGVAVAVALLGLVAGWASNEGTQKQSRKNRAAKSDSAKAPAAQAEAAKTEPGQRSRS